MEKYFFKVAQSYRYTIVSDLNFLEAKVQIVRIPTGSGWRKLEDWEKKPKKTYYVRKTDFVAKKKVEKPKTRVNKMKSITKINRSDRYCALRAILIGKAVSDMKTKLINKLPTTIQMNKEMRIICKR